MQLVLPSDKRKSISVLITDEITRSSIPKSERIHIFSKDNDARLEHAQNIFVVTTGLQLSEIAEFIKNVHKHKSWRGLLIRQETNQNWIPKLLETANLRGLKNLLIYTDNAVIRRVLMAWVNYQAQDQLIADATVLGPMLLVSDCALNSYQIRFEQIKALAQLPAKDRNNFVISAEGSRISWPSYDIDIGLETIKHILDPKPDRELASKHDIAYGLAIAKLRKAGAIKQYQIKGLSERHLRRIETGEQHASIKNLEALCKAHNMKLNDYLNALSIYAGQNLLRIATVPHQKAITQSSKIAAYRLRK